MGRFGKIWLSPVEKALSEDLKCDSSWPRLTNSIVEMRLGWGWTVPLARMNFLAAQGFVWIFSQTHHLRSNTFSHSVHVCNLIGSRCTAHLKKNGPVQPASCCWEVTPAENVYYSFTVQYPQFCDISRPFRLCCVRHNWIFPICCSQKAAFVHLFAKIMSNKHNKIGPLCQTITKQNKTKKSRIWASSSWNSVCNQSVICWQRGARQPLRRIGWGVLRRVRLKIS